MGDVLAVGDQALVQLAGEQGDAAGGWVVTKEVAGEAHLATAAGDEHVLVEPGPLLDGLGPGGLEAGEGDGHHGTASEVRLY